MPSPDPTDQTWRLGSRGAPGARPDGERACTADMVRELYARELGHKRPIVVQMRQRAMAITRLG